MIKVEVYTFGDHVVCTIDHYDTPPGDSTAERRKWVNLAYVTGEPLAHSEGDMLCDLLEAAVRTAEFNAAGLGGWSVLI